jgi:hypothetical protein
MAEPVPTPPLRTEQVTVNGQSTLRLTSFFEGLGRYLKQVAASILNIESEIADIKSNELSAGFIMPYAGNNNPNPGLWLFCDGSEKDRVIFADLFAAIGTIYGAGDESTTFNIPNNQGIGITGAGSQEMDGRTKEAGIVGSKQEDQLQGHYHSLDSDHGDLGDKLQIVNNAAGPTYGIMYFNGQGIGDIEIVAPIANGSDGDPRTGEQTKAASISYDFYIRY